MRKLSLFLLFLLLTYPAYATLTTLQYITADDVSITTLETNRQRTTDAINNFDGGLITSGSITADKLNADANPHNRWNEAFNDFVYTGLTTPTSVTLASTTLAGTAYIDGVRVLKDATAHTYTASKWTFIDLSDTGVFTYQETAISASEPSVSTNSIRLGRISTDSTKVLSVRDDRVTQINIAAGSAGSIADTDANTSILTQKNSNEDILRFNLGNTTLSSAREVLTLQAATASTEKLEPTTTNEVDLGSSSNRFKNIYIYSTVSADTLAFQSGVFVTKILNETDFASNSNSALATQGSTKSYVDARSGKQIFTASGTFTAPAGVTKVFLTIVGCGGGASGGDGSIGGSGGGAGGGLIHYPYTVVAGNNYTVTIGSAGSGGSAGGNGVDGGTSVFDTITIPGGVKGTYSGAGGTGGAANSTNAVTSTAGSFYSIAGGNGAANSAGTGGGGGGSIIGSGAAGTAAASNGASATANTGGGGGAGGAKTPGAVGGNGATGLVIVQW